jgi:hypothetical protein
MDGTQFDTLIKRLGTRSLTRSTALRGVAASVAALAGVSRAAEPSSAKEKRKVCHCTDEKATSCETIEVGKNEARRHLENHECDYRRKCKGRSGCCFANATACTSNTQCCSKFCGDGTCRRKGSCVKQGASCNDTNAAIKDNCCTGECLDGLCRPTGSCKELGAGCGGGPMFPDCCSGNCASGICAP